MLSLLISVAISAALVATSIIMNAKPETTTFSGVVGFIAAYFFVGFIVRKRIMKVQNELQAMLQRNQLQMNRKIQQFQSRPGGNIKAMQRQITEGQKAVCKKALDFTTNLEPFKKWTLTMGRQLATMRLQFFYQLNDFEQVDALFATAGLFKGPIMMEPTMVAMKMARQYKNDDVVGAEKTFTRRIKWFRGNKGTLLYGLMSWIYLKTNESEKARQLLLKAKDITGNETLAYNAQLLSNCKEKSFSNAGLGEEWYGLYLENPPNPKQQRMRGDARGGRGF